MNHKKRWTCLLMLCTLALVVGAACSSILLSTATTSVSKAGLTEANLLVEQPEPTGLAAANRLVSQFARHPTSIGVKVPIGKRIPKGKVIDFVTCGIPYCDSLGADTAAAASVLGWTVNIVQGGETAESIHNAFAQVAAHPPNGVIASGYPTSLFSSSLKTLRTDHVPVMEFALPPQLASGLTLLINTGSPVGVLMAAWVVHATSAHANLLFINDSDYPIIGTVLVGLTTELKKVCPACVLSTINVPTTAIGTTLPNQLVGYLRAHPKVNYVAYGVDAMAIGVPEALTAAGLASRVGSVGESTDIINQQYIANGQESASVLFPGHEVCWRLIDAFARVFTGRSLAPDTTPANTLPMMLLTKKTDTSPTKYAVEVLNYESQFKKLWGIS